jgi:hypothetical protein
VLTRTLTAGAALNLSAKGTADPDHHGLTYRWWHYAEPGTFRGDLRIEASDSPVARIIAPHVSAPVTAHVILEVTDSGEPRLTSYRRVVLTFTP